MLEVDTVAYGSTPTYNGSTPVRVSDGSYEYTFSGWNSAVVAVTGNKTYTAVYSAEEITGIKVTIAVNYSDYGTVDKTTVYVDEGAVISTNDNVLTIGDKTVTATETADNSTYQYVFSYWKNSYGTRAEERTITAVFFRAGASVTIRTGGVEILEGEEYATFDVKTIKYPAGATYALYTEGNSSQNLQPCKICEMRTDFPAVCYIFSGADTPKMDNACRTTWPTAMTMASRACCSSGLTPRIRHWL